jgi:hypothetical protein
MKAADFIRVWEDHHKIGAQKFVTCTAFGYLFWYTGHEDTGPPLI